MTYALTGPNGADLSEVTGLAFDASSRTRSGTPTMAGSATLTATDATGIATAAFAVTVTGPAFASAQADLILPVGRPP